MRMQIRTFPARRLSEAGVRHLFGVPGDFNQSFFERIQDANSIEFLELKLPTMDAPALPKQFAGRLAGFDYGECGPSHPAAAVVHVSDAGIAGTQIVDERA